MNLNDKNVPSSAAGLLRLLLFIVALPISLYISTFIWVQSRTFFASQTYQPIDEPVALGKAVEIETSKPIEVNVFAGEERGKREVKAGSRVKVLGVFMMGLNRQIDGNKSLAPNVPTPTRNYYVELADGTRGIAQLGMEVAADSTSAAETVVYSCPMPGVPSAQLKKHLLVPPYLSIPRYEQEGFYMFPKHSGWNMYNLRPFWRSRFFFVVVWLVLMVLMLKVVGSCSNAAHRKAFATLHDTTLDNPTAYNQAIALYQRLYYPWAFVAGCLFTPLVWIWTKMNYSIFIDSLKKEATNRCPKCHQISLKYETTGRETDKRYLGRFEGRPSSITNATGRVWDRSMDGGKGGWRINTETMHFAKEQWDEYSYQEEMALRCSQCDYCQTEWINRKAYGNRMGGELESVERVTWK